MPPLPSQWTWFSRNGNAGGLARRDKQRCAGLGRDGLTGGHLEGAFWVCTGLPATRQHGLAVVVEDASLRRETRSSVRGAGRLWGVVYRLQTLSAGFPLVEVFL